MHTENGHKIHGLIAQSVRFSALLLQLEAKTDFLLFFKNYGCHLFNFFSVLFSFYLKQVCRTSLCGYFHLEFFSQKHIDSYCR